MGPIAIAMGLAQFAPSILRWITNSDQAADVAQRVVDVAQRVTATTDPAAALAAITGDLKSQQDFQQAMADRELEFDRLYLADRQDARKRDTAIQLAGRKNTRADLMVLLDVVGLVACLAVIALYRDVLPGEVVGIISTISGIFGACLRDAHQFEFGSSRSSQEKDSTIQRLSEPTRPPPRRP